MEIWRRLIRRTTRSDRVTSFPDHRAAGDPNQAARARSILDQIDETTPHRFAVSLVDAASTDRALAALGRSRLITAATTGRDADGRVRIEIASLDSPRWRAITEATRRLKETRIQFVAFEPLDLVTDLTVEDFLDVAEDPPRPQLPSPAQRRRIESLAGPELLAMAMLRPDEFPRPVRSLRPATLTCIAVNTPGSEQRVVQVAADRGLAGYVSAAAARGLVAGATGEPFQPPTEALLHLGRHLDAPHRASVASVIAQMTPPVDGRLVELLFEWLASEHADTQSHAMRALVAVAPPERHREVIAFGLASPRADLQSHALLAMADRYGTEARPIWREHLAARSPTLRDGAQIAIGRHGDEDDLELAVATLAKLLRARPFSVDMGPRGSEIVELLYRHQDHPLANAGLDDITARWGRIPVELQAWLEDEHPELDPAMRAGAPAAQSTEYQPGPDWDLPPIEVEGANRTIRFEDGLAWTPTRERFGELLGAHAQLEVVEDDREFVTVRVTDRDPDRLIAELWRAARKGEPASRQEDSYHRKL